MGVDWAVDLPERIRSHVSDYVAEEIQIGESGAKVLRLTHAEKPNLYLKIDCGGSGIAGAENRVMQWLQGKMRVPEVLQYVRSCGAHYLLMTEVEGLPSYDPRLRKDISRLIAALARGLREFHQLSAQGCPFRLDIHRLLRQAEKRVAAGLIDVDGLTRNAPGRTPNGLLQELQQLIPPQGETVVAHGDFCMPNLLMKEGAVSGFIDLGDVAIADPYVDLVAMKFSLRLNGFGGGWFAEFVRDYGISELDVDRLRFYELLRILA